MLGSNASAKGLYTHTPITKQRRSFECEIVRIDFSGIDLNQGKRSKDEPLSSNGVYLEEHFSERNSVSEEDQPIESKSKTETSSFNVELVQKDIMKTEEQRRKERQFAQRSRSLCFGPIRGSLLAVIHENEAENKPMYDSK